MNRVTTYLQLTMKLFENVLEPKNVKAHVFKSTKITEPYHEIQAELTLKFEKLKLMEQIKVPKNQIDLVLVASCLKLSYLPSVGTP